MSRVITNNFSALKWHITLSVNGFSEKKSTDFSKRKDIIDCDAEEDLIKMYERFSGMSLGLLAAKSFCKQRDELNCKSNLLLTEDSDYKRCYTTGIQSISFDGMKFFSRKRHQFR